MLSVLWLVHGVQNGFWMFTFLRLLIKDKISDTNERLLVLSARFNKEIPAYFNNGKINLEH